MSPSEPPALHFTPAPAPLCAWASGAVSVRLPLGLARSSFPASVGGMLVVRLAGQSWRVLGEAQAAAAVPGAHARLAEQWVPPVALVGPSVGPMHFRQEGPLQACGLLLTPAGVTLLARQPNRWCVGEVFDLDTLGPAMGPAALQGRLALAGSDPARAQGLFAWLADEVAARARQDAAAATRALAAGRLAPLLAQGLDSACGALGLSARQLERRSQAELGMPPQRVQAVVRMQAALFDALRAPTIAPPSGGADLALRHGYYDQSHLGRDLRRLAGAPLGRIVAAASHAAAPQDALWAFGAGRAQAQAQAQTQVQWGALPLTAAPRQQG